MLPETARPKMTSDCIPNPRKEEAVNSKRKLGEPFPEHFETKLSCQLNNLT